MTLQQRMLLKTIGKSRSKKEAMLNAGYSLNTASKQQSRVFNQKEIQELLAKNDELAIKTHTKAFYASRRDHFSGEIQEDTNAQLKAVDLHYKARGWLKDQDITGGGNLTVVYNFIEPDGLSHPQSQTDNPGSETIQDSQLAQEGT